MNGRSCRAKLSLILLLMAVPASCRGTKSNQTELQPSDVAEVEDSGRKLSGEFELKKVEDQYSTAAVQDGWQTLFKFDEDGNFKRERSGAGRPARVEEGTYIIGRGGELVLYVEKDGGEPLTGARREALMIEDQGEPRLMLREGAARRLVFERKR